MDRHFSNFAFYSFSLFTSEKSAYWIFPSIINVIRGQIRILLLWQGRRVRSWKEKKNKFKQK